MVERSVIVRLDSGLHARPASTFVQMANRFQSNISLVKNDKTANAKSILGIMSLACTKGSEVRLVVDGADENAALEELAAFLEREDG